MIWEVTIAIFLGTLAVPLLLFLLLSQKERIRKALKERRRESRTPVKVSLELSSLGEPPVYETAPTENISRHGARVVTIQRWRRKERVEAILPLPIGRSRARIAYCDHLPGEKFAVGLKFSSEVDSPDLESTNNPYGK